MRDFFRAFTIGAIGYPIIEIFYRGNSHWSMALTGGLCLALLLGLNNSARFGKGLRFYFFGPLLITFIELCCGLIVNMGLGLKVWSYSNLSFNLWGQICLRFTFAWFLLCIAVRPLLNFLCRHPHANIRQVKTEEAPT